MARKNSQASNVKVADGNKASAQERLERVWTKLKLPDRMKLDMAVKYRCGCGVGAPIYNFLLSHCSNLVDNIYSAVLKST